MNKIKWDNVKMVDTYGANHFLPYMSIISVIIPNNTVKYITKFLDSRYMTRNTFVWYSAKSGFFRTKIIMVGVNKDIYKMFNDISWHVTADSCVDIGH